MKHDASVVEVMTKHPRSVRVDQKLSDVRKLLAEGRFHHMPVVEGKKLVGLISSTDLMRLEFSLFEPDETFTDYLDSRFSLADLVQADPVTVGAEATVREAAEALRTGRIHSVPVVDDEGNLVGIVTSTDIISFFLSELAR